jgi:HD-GYP domain-containing protein (c-di-GMP phosphodiesterase class II)
MERTAYVLEDRAYRAALGHDKAQCELRSGSGTRFDPQVVAPFTAVLAPAGGVRRQVGVPAV